MIGMMGLGKSGGCCGTLIEVGGRSETTELVGGSATGAGVPEKSAKL